MNSVGFLFSEASHDQLAATMILIVFGLVTAWILTRRKPEEDDEAEIPPVVTFQCESCGEDLNADDAPCPMCGGRVLRIETRPNELGQQSEIRDPL